MPSRSRSSWSFATRPSTEPMNTCGDSRNSSSEISIPVRFRIPSSTSAASLRGVVGEDRARAGRVDVDLERVEPVARRLADPAELLLGRGDRDRARVRRGPRPPPEAEASVRGATPTMSASRPASVSSRLPPPPMNSGGLRPLDRLRQPVVVRDRVDARPAKQNGPSPKQPFSTATASVEPADARADRVERDPQRLVLRHVPARADRDLDPAAADHVERRQVLGEQRRVAQVVVDHERPRPAAVR